MTDQVAERMRAIEGSSLRGLNLGGQGIVSLASGDPAPLVPGMVVDALESATHAARFAYAHPQGVLELREGIVAEWIDAGVSAVKADQVVVTHGATGGIAATCLALLNPGDRALLVTPTYSLYADAIRLAGAEPESVACEAPFKLPLDDLARRLPGAKVLFLCNPSNPTGTFFGRDDLVLLAEMVERTGTLVVVDEAYSSIVFPPGEFVSAAAVEALHNRLVLLQTYSKRFCLTGLRLGYIWAPLGLVGPILRAHRTFAGPVNIVGQHAVASLLDQDRPWEAELLGQYAKRRGLVDDVLGELPGVAYESPTATFFAFFRPAPSRPGDLHVKRLLQAGVALRPGEEFGAGGEGYVRLAFCGDLDELQLGLERIATCLAVHATVADPNRDGEDKEVKR